MWRGGICVGGRYVPLLLLLEILLDSRNKPVFLFWLEIGDSQDGTAASCGCSVWVAACSCRWMRGRSAFVLRMVWGHGSRASWEYSKQNEHGQFVFFTHNPIHTWKYMMTLAQQAGRQAS